MQTQLNKLIEIIQNGEYTLYSKENREKSTILQNMKPSTKETILYFKETDLDFFPNKDFISVKDLSFEEFINIDIPKFFDKRSLLEYFPNQRHPIPYIVLEHNNKYFIIIREKNSGEMRLIGKNGLVGGHIGIEDVVYNNKKLNLKETLTNGLYRELEEETGLKKENVLNEEFIGFIKINEEKVVEFDHLGLVYILHINTNNFSTLETGVLTGAWWTKEDIITNIDTFENWSKLIFTNLFINKKE